MSPAKFKSDDRGLRGPIESNRIELGNLKFDSYELWIDSIRFVIGRTFIM
jgi:hypothetical protein